MTNTNNTQGSRISVRALTVTAMLSAMAYILMFFDFSVPFMPAFIKMDLSELPALIASFSLGPVYGAIVCLIKNVIHLLQTSTGGVGELSNFLIGVCFVVPAGVIYNIRKTKKGALIGSVVGMICMGLLSIVTNYFVVYPIYYNFMPEEVILQAYQAILPSMKSILQCLICFNAPFTALKGLVSVVITMLIYKPLSPIIKGTR